MKQALRYNNKVIKKIYQGDELVKKMNYGQSSDVFQYIKKEDAPHDYSKDYLTIESTSDYNTIRWKATRSDSTKTISASTDNGETWTKYTSTTGGIMLARLNTGDKLLVKGENSTYASSKPTMSIYNRFTSTGKYKVYGNIMSLIYGDNFIGQTSLTANYALIHLFSQSETIISAENLVLPATTLTDYCYASMFDGCTSLTTAPELPATTLAGHCYSWMFYGCTSLTTAPELPATTLALGCYYGMFHGSTSLNYIKCLATNIRAISCTTGWVDGVATSGTFVKNAAMTSWTTGSNGIPTGWTVVNA